MDLRVVLLVKEEDAKEAYVSATEKLGVQVDTVSTFWELRSAIIETPCHGVMVDLKAKIKSSKEEKEFAHEILELYPVVQVKWEPDTGEIRTLYFGQAKGGGTLEEFIENECGSFKPRAIRTSHRKKIHYNVILSKESGISQNAVEKTVTMDVSKGGCFIYSGDEWQVSSNAWLIIKELEDDTPIRSVVRWAIPWGESMRIPGIGVNFEDIHENQLSGISETKYLGL